MNIVQEEKGQLESILKVSITEEDYKDKVTAELRNMQKKAQMPGFRPGKVPFGMIQKMYGKSVLAEEVNKVMVDAVYKYIQDNGIDILGNPLPDMEQAKDLDWDTQKDFEFHYRVGLSPKIDLSLSEEIKVDYHKVQPSKEVVDKQLSELARRYGKVVNPGVSEKDDVLLGELQEMISEEEVKPEGHVHKTNIFISYVKDEAAREKLIGMKPGEKVVFDVVNAVGSETEAAGMLGVKKEELSNLGPLFSFTVESISRIEPASMDKELFEKAAPGKDINTEEEFRQFITEQISKQYQADADKHFKNEAIKKLLSITNLQLPEDFLKDWLVEANQELTQDQVENEFGKFLESFRWQLLENHLLKVNKIEVSPDEVKKHLEDYFRIQMRQYGQIDVEQEMVDQFVSNIIKNKDEVKKVYDHLFDEKMLDLLKSKLKLNEIEIDFDDFVKLVTEKYQG
jgi:trigger factor